MAALAVLAALVPGFDLHEQPHLPEAFTAHLAVVHELQEVMADADAAVEEFLAAQAAEQAAAEAAAAQAAAEAERAAVTATLEQGRYGVGEPWATLAECESGDWVDGGRSFVAGSARWDWPAGGVPPWGTTIHHGGLQFHPSTWSWVAPMVGLGHIAYAYQATPTQQVQVARKVQELQGWQAWPVCSRKVGLR